MTGHVNGSGGSATVSYLEQELDRTQDELRDTRIVSRYLVRQVQLLHRERWTWVAVGAFQILFDAWVVFGDHLVIG